MKKGLTLTKWRNKFDIKKILNLEKEGKNIIEISKILEIPNRRLGELLKEHNINLNSKQQKINKNNDFFEIIDSEIKAYLLGYTVADGCVSIEPKKKNNKIYSYTKRLSFNVSINDKEIINLLQYYISPESKIKEFHNLKKATNRKKKLCLRFSSNKIVEDLIKLNIIPNKTYHSNFKFDFTKIPTKYHKDFIRGFFDGDGSINESTFQFVSTSKEYLKQILQILLFNIPNITYRIYKTKGKTIDYYRLCINLGKGIKNKIYEYLYKNSNFYLQRKKNKFNIENTVLNFEINKSKSV